VNRCTTTPNLPNAHIPRNPYGQIWNKPVLGTRGKREEAKEKRQERRGKRPEIQKRERERETG
jgi:hypothetical protein